MSRQADKAVHSTTYLTLPQLCDEFSISLATGRNWIKLGKICPDKYQDKTPLFSKASIKIIRKELLSSKSKTLKSRRNKAFVSGNTLYKSYIDRRSDNYLLVQSLLKCLVEHSIHVTEPLLCLLLADCALTLLKQCFQQDNATSEYALLLEPLMGSRQQVHKAYEAYPYLFGIPYSYQDGEDLLGLLYLSLKSIRSRKATGSYYTPTDIVKKLILHLSEDAPIGQNETILDPCCGTGNFLIQLPEHITPSQVYANDIDRLSVVLTRINVALHFKISDISMLEQHITQSDFLTSGKRRHFDIIIGNPPWGYLYTDAQKNKLKNRFFCASGNSIESFDLFLEKALSQLTPHGRLSFVLPEAILTVKSHLAIRSYLLEHSTIKRIDYLGERFDKVQCPSILLHLAAANETFHCKGIRITSPDDSFLIQEEREVSSQRFSFLIRDEEYAILQKMRSLRDVTFLKNQADFALGIVSGNNLSLISDMKKTGQEVILKGCDIVKYQIRPADRYINFTPAAYQQVAPEQYYRVPEKLLYRFISDQLVFAYDDRQYVTLNSCNIVIPHIEGLHMKYILAILNSSMAQFYFQKEFHSVKILRSHIEQIPIPRPCEKQQQEILALVDILLTEKNKDAFQDTYDQLDRLIASLYRLSDKQYALIAHKESFPVPSSS